MNRFLSALLLTPVVLFGIPAYAAEAEADATTLMDPSKHISTTYNEFK